MEKIVKQIRHSLRKAGSLLAELLGAQPVFCPVPVRIERGHHKLSKTTFNLMRNE